MTVEEECRCSDTSEPSNVTSLHSDISSIINCSGPNRTFVDPADSSRNLSDSDNDCTCQPVQHTANFSAPPARSVPSKEMQSAHQAPPTNCQPRAPLHQSMTQCESIVPCLCHAHRANNYGMSVKCTRGASDVQSPLWSRFNWKWPRRGYLKRKEETYRVKLKKNQYKHYPKDYASCDMSDGIPRQKKLTPRNIDSPMDQPDAKEEYSERIDIYYFDHGNSAYYRTTDSPPILATEKCAEKSDYIATRFWAEIFGTVHIGIAFVTAFILQLFRFILFSIIRPLTVGLLQLFADYFTKPFLSIIFNALIQPILILLYNVATSFRDLCEPLAEALGFFLRELAHVFRSFRIVEVNGANAATGCT